jgi:hypothetical protein
VVNGEEVEAMRGCLWRVERMGEVTTEEEEWAMRKVEDDDR